NRNPADCRGCWFSTKGARAMYDLVLKGGRIYDGSGMPSFNGDVAIENGKIVAIGRLNGGATRTLNVDGLAVAPGFIDPHTHLDAQLLWDPLGTSSCFHGVTSVVLGNCGLSLAPAKPENRESMIKSFVRVEAISRRVLEEGVEWKWTSTAEYLSTLGTRLGINAAALIGHIAVRHYVMGEDAVERQATVEEIARMKQLVRQGMEAGAVGFSTNQNPRHIREDRKPVASRLASDEELGSLLDVLGEMNAGVVQLSGGGADSRGRIAYAAQMARRTGRPVLWQSISHSWSRPNHWQEMLANTQRVFEEEGLPIFAMTQAKPFQNRYSLLDAQCFDEFPTWKAAMFSPVPVRKQMFADPELRRKLRAEAIEDQSPSVFPKRWDVIIVDHVKLEHNKSLQGKSVQDIAEAQKKDGLDCFLDLSLEEDLETRFVHINTQGDPKAVCEILKHPAVMIGQSDAGAHMGYDARFGYCTAFLGRWVRGYGIMNLEEAVAKLTFRVASVFGLNDRGLLRPGLAADIAVFDPATINTLEPEYVRDLPGNETRMIQKATGVPFTVVNGEIVIENGAPTGARPGKVLRPGSWKN
ncbi:MAG TPA: amidohydrolase family protein, partial [Candidatus Saccharimonadales bacterium]|nr:amidohydrolase family protein [Candidatus Saccharimonadales bacterium]